MNRGCGSNNSELVYKTELRSAKREVQQSSSAWQSSLLQVCLRRNPSVVWPSPRKIIIILSTIGPFQFTNNFSLWTFYEKLQCTWSSQNRRQLELKKFICQSRHQFCRLSSLVCRPANRSPVLNYECTVLWVVLPATQGRSVDKDLVNEMSQKGHLRKTRGKDYKLLDIIKITSY